MKNFKAIRQYYLIVVLIVFIVMLLVSCNTTKSLYSNEWTMLFGFTTLQEDPGTRFEIQSSNDGIYFYNKVNFDGTGHPNKYEISIPWSAGGFYRLKVIDRDNIIWYSPVVK